LVRFRANQVKAAEHRVAEIFDVEVKRSTVDELEAEVGDRGKGPPCDPIALSLNL
jgi:hypothetical protein